MENYHLEQVIYHLSALSPIEKTAAKWYLEREHILRHAIKWTPLSQEEYEDQLDNAKAYNDAELLALISCQRVFTQDKIRLD